MKQVCHFITLFLVVAAVGPLATAAQPTFADLSVLLAKGYFKNKVPASASLEECASFLNDHGVCFSLFDLMDPMAVVTQEDFARVVGQSTLIFLGEAEVRDGCVKKPSGIDKWVDYCLLNDVDLKLLWRGFVQRVEDVPLVEVQRFFGNSPVAGE